MSFEVKKSERRILLNIYYFINMFSIFKFFSSEIMPKNIKRLL